MLSLGSQAIRTDQMGSYLYEGSAEPWRRGGRGAVRTTSLSTVHPRPQDRSYGQVVKLHGTDKETEAQFTVTR